MAATALNMVRMGVITPEVYDEYSSKSMDLWLKRHNRIPIQMGMFFSDHKARTLTFDLTTCGNEMGMPIKRGDTGALPFDQPPNAYTSQVTIDTYQSAVRLTRTMLKTDLSGKAGQLAGGLPDAAKRWKELKMAHVINTGATVAGADGSYVYASDHYYEDPSFGQWSNLATGADLNSTSYEVSRLALRTRKNARGQRQAVLVNLVCGSPALEPVMKKIANSELVPELSTHAINPYKGLQWKVLDYMTDTNAWFAWGDLPESMWGFHYVYLTEPEIGALAYPDTDHPHIKRGFYLYIQAAAKASQAKNIHWNPGT